MARQIVRLEHHILRDAREALCLTQQQVADKAKIQLRQYQRFESGERNLSSSSFEIARRVLTALGLDMTTYANGKYSLADVSLSDSDKVLFDAAIKKTPENLMVAEVTETIVASTKTPIPDTRVAERVEQKGAKSALPEVSSSAREVFKDKICFFLGRLERCSKTVAHDLVFRTGGVANNNFSVIIDYVITGSGAESTKVYPEIMDWAESKALVVLREQEFFDTIEGKYIPKRIDHTETTEHLEVIEYKRLKYAVKRRCFPYSNNQI